MTKPKNAVKADEEAGALARVLGLSCVYVTVRGEELAIEEFELADLPALTSIIKRAYQAAGTQTLDAATMQSAGEIGIELCMLATKKDRAFFDRMPLGDAMGIFAAIFEVNESFFTHLPGFLGVAQGAVGLLTTATKGSG